MKKIVFTVTLLISLGTVWVLYLEYDDKRFLEKLPKSPSPDIQRTNATNTPTPQGTGASSGSEDRNTNTIVPEPRIPVEETPTTSEQTKPAALLHEDTAEITVAAMIDFFKEALAQSDSSREAEIKDAFENFLESEGITQKEYERPEIAQEVLNRFMKDPANVIAGSPMEIGAVYLISEDLLKAAIILDPSEKNKSALERFRKRSGEY